MNSNARILLFGVGVWLLPFIAGILAFALQASRPALFDSLMFIALTLAAVVFSVWLIRTQIVETSMQALAIGSIWIVVCLAIDVPMFVFGFGMSLNAYAIEIGINYFVVPIVLVGVALAARTAKSNESMSS